MMIQDSSISKVSQMTGIQFLGWAELFSSWYIQSDHGTFYIQWVLEAISKVNSFHLMLWSTALPSQCCMPSLHGA